MGALLPFCFRDAGYVLLGRLPAVARAAENLNVLQNRLAPQRVRDNVVVVGVARGKAGSAGFALPVGALPRRRLSF